MSDLSAIPAAQLNPDLVAQFRTDTAVALTEGKGIVEQLRAQLALAVTATAEADQRQKQASATLTEAANTLEQAKKISGDATELAGRLIASEATVLEHSTNIIASKDHTLKVKNEIDALLEKVTGLAAQTEKLTADTAVASTNADEFLAKTQTSSKTSEEASVLITASKVEAKESEAALAGMAAKAATTEARILDYEKKLGDLEIQARAHLATIVGLLPGAGSAGLASAFDKRGLTFKGPGKRWQITFIASIVILILLACSGLWAVYKSATPLTYDELFRLWLSRLPIAGALVWLALHAGRESALAQRLEEDYGYKSAIAASFLGFNEQMSKLTELAVPNSPIAKLCSDTLATIASPPGRIYDKHQLTVSPTGEITDAISKIGTIGNSDKG